MNKVQPRAVPLPGLGRVQPAPRSSLLSPNAWHPLATVLLLTFAAAASPLTHRSHAFGAETTSSARTFAPQVSRAKAVTVTIIPLNIAVGRGTWDFKVVLDTHSQDLQDDLLKSAALIEETGTEQRPVAWQSTPPGGHHREGVLQFNAPEPRPGTMKLRLERPNEQQPPTFTWPAR